MTATADILGVGLTLKSWQGQLTPEAAKAILALRANQPALARYEELAGKSNAGTLSETERKELDAIVELNDLVGVFKAHAATVLTRQ